MTTTTSNSTSYTIFANMTTIQLPPRCAVGQQLWRDIDAAIDAIEYDDRGGATPDSRSRIRRALEAYYAHKNGVYKYSKYGTRKEQVTPPCDDCYAARRGRG